MAGLGSRFRVSNYDTPKPLIVVNGKTLVEHSISSLNMDGDYIFITRKFDNPEHNESLSRILKTLKPNSIEICINSTTRGAVETCLFARSQINTEEELVITNCDQILNWNSENYLEQSRATGIDGSVLLYDSEDPKNSFAKINQNGFITEIVEKQAISNNALVGLHYWKHGKDFVRSAESLMNDFVVMGKKECYVSETYNNLVSEGKQIKGIKVSTNGYIPLGTPKDLSLYLGKLKEFYTEKPKTIFCDIDGTLLKHAHCFSDIKDTDPMVLSGVLKKINEWDQFNVEVLFPILIID